MSRARIVPDGPLSYACGTAGEAWPLTTAQQLVHKRKSDRAFSTNEFNPIKKKLSDAPRPPFSEQHVDSIEDSVVEVASDRSMQSRLQCSRLSRRFIDFP